MICVVVGAVPVIPTYPVGIAYIPEKSNTDGAIRKFRIPGKSSAFLSALHFTIKMMKQTRLAASRAQPTVDSMEYDETAGLESTPQKTAIVNKIVAGKRMPNCNKFNSRTLEFFSFIGCCLVIQDA